MTPRFTVRDKSLIPFFQTMLTSQQGEMQRILNDNSRPFNPYYLMKDVIYFKKDNGIAKGDVVQFEIKDQARESDSKLLNTYLYEAFEYDDISIELKLVGFDVDVIEMIPSKPMSGMY